MGKLDREFEWRMQGMAYALKIAKEKGIEGLENELKFRNFTRLDIPWEVEEWNEAMKILAQANYNNTLTVGAWVLHEQFGFGKERLQKWKRGYDKATDDAFDLNWLMERYVTLTDYAVELNNNYDLGINIDCVGANEDKFHVSRTDGLKKWSDGIINTLILGGFQDAAEYLREKRDRELK